MFLTNFACVCLLAENEVEIALTVKAGANVVQVYGFCFDAPDGKLRIVMELCSHGSLRAHLKALPRDKVCVCVVGITICWLAPELLDVW